MLIKRRLAIYEAPETGVDWGWCQAAELSDMLKQRASYLVQKYGYLSRDYDQYGTLSYTEGPTIGRTAVSTLVKYLQALEANEPTGLQGFYFPAGWVNAVIDAETGKTGQVMQYRIETKAKSIVSQFRSNGYALYEFAASDHDFANQVNDEVLRILSAKQPNIIRAKRNEDPETGYCDSEWVYFDPTRYAMVSIDYGTNHQISEMTEAKNQGFFQVAADRVSTWGSIYYLKELKQQDKSAD